MDSTHKKELIGVPKKGLLVGENTLNNKGSKISNLLRDE